MKIEIINKEREELNGIVEVSKDYTVPKNKSILESTSYHQEDGFYEERKHIHLNGVLIDQFKRSSIKKQEVLVRSDSPFIQMHFELSGGATCYKQSNSGFTIPTMQGEFSTFYLPHLDGTLRDPPCCNAVSLEIQLSESWIREHIGDDSESGLNFIEGLNSSRPTLLGGKSFIITPIIYQTIHELCNCPYTGNIKRLFIEGKLLELLAHQLHQTGSVKTSVCKNTLSKRDIENLQFIKEKITSELSKNHTIQELAYLTFMNRTKMQAGFKVLFGCTVHEFIVECRMTEAYRMLTEAYSNTWNISEIAHRVGYQHYNHFSMVFKKRFGVSPSSFLKK